MSNEPFREVHRPSLSARLQRWIEIAAAIILLCSLCSCLGLSLLHGTVDWLNGAGRAPIGPSLWEIQNCGVDASFSSGVVVVTFRKRQGDATLARIAPYLTTLGQPVHLQMENCKVTDAGLVSLKGLTNIRGLRLGHQQKPGHPRFCLCRRC
jgi:hypothetical protein